MSSLNKVGGGLVYSNAMLVMHESRRRELRPREKIRHHAPQSQAGGAPAHSVLSVSQALVKDTQRHASSRVQTVHTAPPPVTELPFATVWTHHPHPTGSIAPLLTSSRNELWQAGVGEGRLRAGEGRHGEGRQVRVQGGAEGAGADERASGACRQGGRERRRGARGGGGGGTHARVLPGAAGAATAAAQQRCKQELRIVTRGVSGGRSLTRPLRDARRFHSTRWYLVPGATRTPRKFGICLSSKDHSLSRRAKP
jgi:hypothetical protein